MGYDQKVFWRERGREISSRDWARFIRDLERSEEMWKKSDEELLRRIEDRIDEEFTMTIRGEEIQFKKPKRKEEN